MDSHSTGCWLLVKFIHNYAYSNILWLVFVTDCELHALHACLQSIISLLILFYW